MSAAQITSKIALYFIAQLLLCLILTSPYMWFDLITREYTWFIESTPRAGADCCCKIPPFTPAVDSMEKFLVLLAIFAISTFGLFLLADKAYDEMKIRAAILEKSIAAGVPAPRHSYREYPYATAFVASGFVFAAIAFLSFGFSSQYIVKIADIPSRCWTFVIFMEFYFSFMRYIPSITAEKDLPPAQTTG